MRSKALCWGAAGLALAAHSVSAQAQSAPSPSAPTPAPEATDGGLEEVVVTAQRRSENLQSVPIAVTAITASRLASSGIGNAQDLTIAAPSLSVASAVGYFQPRIRGIGTTANGPGIENPIAVYVDGVYIAAAPSSLFSFNNIERVEVLKGPQGTLFGRNATGGLIQVITRNPLAQASGSFSVGYGNYDTLTTSAYLTGGLTRGVAADIAVQMSRQGDGYGTNFATGTDANRVERDIAVRSKLLIQPTADTTVRLSGDYSDGRGNFPYLRAWRGDVPVFGPPTPGDAWDANSDIPTLSRSKSGGGSLTIEQDAGFARLVSITAYRRATYRTQFDYDLTPTPALGLFVRQTDRQFSQEVQIASQPTSAIKWLAGGYYFRARSAYDPVDVVQGGPLINPVFPLQTIRTNSAQRTRSLAAFGQLTVPLGEKTNLTGGLRYTDERRQLEGVITGLLVGGVPIGPLGPPVSARQDFSKLTWRLSLDHSFDNVLAYASFNRGFKSGGFNPQIITDGGFRPEVVDAYELGLKVTLPGRLRFNPSLFYYDYTNIQVPYFSASGQLGIVNGPSAKIYGFDLDFEYSLTPRFRLSGGATVMHDRFGNYPGAVFNLRRPVGNQQTTGDATGNRLPFTSDWSISVAADYKIDTRPGQFSFNLSYNHNDGYFPEADNLRRQGAFNLVNGSISLQPAGTQLTITAWIKNVLNEAVLLQLASAPQVTAASYQAPRTFGASVGVKF